MSSVHTQPFAFLRSIALNKHLNINSKIIFYGSKGKRCFGVTSDIFNFENICDYVKEYFGETLLTIAATAIFDDEVIGLFLFKWKKMISEMVVNASNTNDNQENIFSSKKRSPEKIYKFFDVDAEKLDCFTTDDFQALISLYARYWICLLSLKHKYVTNKI